MNSFDLGSAQVARIGDIAGKKTFCQPQPTVQRYRVQCSVSVDAGRDLKTVVGKESRSPRVAWKVYASNPDGSVANRRPRRMLELFLEPSRSEIEKY